MSVQPERQVSREELEAMMSEGMTDPAIALALDMKLDALRRLRHRRGLLRVPRRPNNSRKTPEELARVEQFLDEGMSVRSVAQLTGIQQKTILRHFPGRGFTRQQTLEAQLMGRELSRIAS